jgi:hypothetical protein
MTSPHSLVLVTIALLWLGGLIVTISSIGSPRLAITPLTRGVWIAFAFLFPVLGPTAWFLAARPLIARA